MTIVSFEIRVACCLQRAQLHLFRTDKTAVLGDGTPRAFGTPDTHARVNSSLLVSLATPPDQNEMQKPSPTSAVAHTSMLASAGALTTAHHMLALRRRGSALMATRATCSSRPPRRAMLAYPETSSSSLPVAATLEIACAAACDAPQVAAVRHP